MKLAQLSLRVAAFSKTVPKHECYGNVTCLIAKNDVTYISIGCQTKPDLFIWKNSSPRPAKLMRLARLLDLGHREFSPWLTKSLIHGKIAIQAYCYPAHMKVEALKIK